MKSVRLCVLLVFLAVMATSAFAGWSPWGGYFNSGGNAGLQGLFQLPPGVGTAAQLIASLPNGVSNSGVGAYNPLIPGSMGNANCRNVGISGNGRYIVFESWATNLIAPPLGAMPQPQIYRRDTLTNTTILISSTLPGSPLGIPADGPCGHPKIDDDGSVIVFDSTATNLTADPGYLLVPQSNVFRVNFEVLGGAPQLISRATGVAGAMGDANSVFPSVSADGTIVAFESLAKNLVASPGPAGVREIYVRDGGGVTRLISCIDGTPNPAPANCHVPSISPDGRWVSFGSAAPLVPFDTNLTNDIYVRDRPNNRTILASVGDTGLLSDGLSNMSCISDTNPDGNSCYVAFTSWATNLLVDQGGAQIALPALRQIYRRLVISAPPGSQAGTGTTEIVSCNNAFTILPIGFAGAVANFGCNATTDPMFTASLPHGLWIIHPPSISANGQYVTFSSTATNLVPGVNAGVQNVFVRDMVNQETNVISNTPLPWGWQSNVPSEISAINAQAGAGGTGIVAFDTISASFVNPWDFNGFWDIYYANNPPASRPVALLAAPALANIPVNPPVYNLPYNRPIRFSAAGSNDPDATHTFNLLMFSWSFDDGVTWTPPVSGALGGETIVHTFQQPGLFHVRVRVTDPLNLSDQNELIVNATNAKPTGTLDVAPNTAWRNITPVTATCNYNDENRDIASVVLNWGDGTPVVNLPVAGSLPITRVPTVAGTFNVTLTITDLRGEVTTITKQLIVRINTSPICDVRASNMAPKKGEVVTFTSANSVDNDPGDGIAFREWDLDEDNSFEPTPNSVQVTKAFTTSGDHTIRLRVTDTNGVISTCEVTIKVTNQNPTGELIVNPAKVYKDFTTVSAVCTGADPDGDPISFTLSWGDGSADIAWSGNDPRPLTHVYTSAQLFNVRLTVKDNNGGMVEKNASVNVTVNQPPVCAITATPNPGNKKANVVLSAAGSSDPEGDTLTYAWDLDNDGNFVPGGPTNTVKYDLSGTHTVSVQVTDSYGQTSSCKVNVVAINQPPTCQLSLGPAEVYQSVTNVTATINFADPDDAVISATLNWGDSTPTVNLSTIPAPVSHAYTQAGLFTVTLTATDSEGATKTCAQQITVNPSPVDVSINAIETKTPISPFASRNQLVRVKAANGSNVFDAVVNVTLKRIRSKTGAVDTIASWSSVNIPKGQTITLKPELVYTYQTLDQTSVTWQAEVVLLNGTDMNLANNTKSCLVKVYPPVSWK